MKKWNLLIDAAKCNNCNNGVIPAKDEHIGNDYPGYAAPQPRQRHCMKADSKKYAGEGAAICKRSDGLALIDPVKAKERRDLVAACP